MKTKTAERGSWLRTGIANCRTKFPAVFREIFENFRRILKLNYLVLVLSWNRVWETLCYGIATNGRMTVNGE